MRLAGEAGAIMGTSPVSGRPVPADPSLASILEDLDREITACREALEPKLWPVGCRNDVALVAARQLPGLLAIRRRLVDRIGDAQ